MSANIKVDDLNKQILRKKLQILNAQITIIFVKMLFKIN